MMNTAMSNNWKKTEKSSTGEYLLPLFEKPDSGNQRR